MGWMRQRQGERGQTTTEYLMIVGLMGAVIVTVFVTFFWSNVKVATQSWSSNVKHVINGKNIN